MIWECIYIEDIKVKFDRIESINSGVIQKVLNKKYAIFKEVNSDYEYYVNTNSDYVNISQLKKGDMLVMQRMIFKNGSEYKSKIGFAQKHIYSEYKELSESEKGFYEFKLDEINKRCTEYEINKIRRKYRVAVNIGSITTIGVVTALASGSI